MTRPKIALFLVLTSLLAAPVFAQSGSSPTAVLQAPGTIAFGAPLTLNGAKSFDTDGTIIRYVWTKLTGEGGAMTLNQAFGTLEPTFVVPQPAGRSLAIGRHRFRLVVDDNSGNHSNPTEVEVIVVDSTAPTAVLDAPDSIAFGAPLHTERSAIERHRRPRRPIRLDPCPGQRQRPAAESAAGHRYEQPPRAAAGRQFSRGGPAYLPAVRQR